MPLPLFSHSTMHRPLRPKMTAGRLGPSGFTRQGCASTSTSNLTSTATMSAPPTLTSLFIVNPSLTMAEGIAKKQHVKQLSSLWTPSWCLCRLPRGQCPYRWKHHSRVLLSVRHLMFPLEQKPPVRGTVASALNALSDEPLSAGWLQIDKNCFLFKIILFYFLASVMQPLPLHWQLKRSVSVPKCQFSPAGQSLIPPFLEQFEHNLGQENYIKRLFQPTVAPISALGPNYPRLIGLYWPWFKGAKLNSKIGPYFTHRNGPIFRGAPRASRARELSPKAY